MRYLQFDWKNAQNPKSRDNTKCSILMHQKEELEEAIIFYNKNNLGRAFFPIFCSNSFTSKTFCRMKKFKAPRRSSFQDFFKTKKKGKIVKKALLQK